VHLVSSSINIPVNSASRIHNDLHLSRSSNARTYISLQMDPLET
jgi:hypothetical protein